MCSIVVVFGGHLVNVCAKVLTIDLRVLIEEHRSRKEDRMRRTLIYTCVPGHGSSRSEASIAIKELEEAANEANPW